MAGRRHALLVLLAVSVVATSCCSLVTAQYDTPATTTTAQYDTPATTTTAQYDTPAATTTAQYDTPAATSAQYKPAPATTTAQYKPAPATTTAQYTPAAVADICRGTSFPELCTVTAGKQAARYGGAAVDALTVLQMQVDALAMRTEAARARVDRESAAASPAARAALEQCNAFYGDVMENLGACRRAIGHKDAVTIRSTMSMVAQDLQFCDEEFRKAGEKNPLEHFDQSLVNMSEICRSLSNMIVV